MKKRASIAKPKRTKALPPSICNVSVVSDDFGLYDPLLCNEAPLCDASLLCNDAFLCNDPLLCNDAFPCNDSLLCNDSCLCDETGLCDAATTPNVERQSSGAPIERNANPNPADEQLQLLHQDWECYGTEAALSRHKKAKKRKALKHATSAHSITRGDHNISLLRTKTQTIVLHPQFAGVLVVAKRCCSWSLFIEPSTRPLIFDSRKQAERNAIAAMKCIAVD